MENDNVFVVKVFNGRFSRIIVDDGCWVLQNGGAGKWKSTYWIFGGAMEILKALPRSPKMYEPYQRYLQRKGNEKLNEINKGE